MKGTFRFLGTGASMGVPVIGCECPICNSSDPKNSRLRTSGLLSIDGKQILVDAGPDLRQQALNAGIDHVDGLLLTHAHYDHIGGLDELRIFFFRTKKPVPCLLSRPSYDEVRERFGYFFHDLDVTKSVAAQFDFQVIEAERANQQFLGIPFHTFTVFQGPTKVIGFRLGDFAYLSDICQYPETIFDDLKGVCTLVTSALRYTPSPVHFTVDQAVAFAQKVGAEQTYFVHMAHDLDHETTNKQLPDGIQLAYDGLTIEFNT